MSVYQLLTSWMSVSNMCKITSTQQGEGFTLYIIEVTIAPYQWTVSHRYSEFRDLHEKLVTQYNIDKSLLPPKKIFGNQTEVFVQKRQADLELYLHSVIHQTPQIPPALAEFLDFSHYEVHYIVESLAEMLFYEGDRILQTDSIFTISPLQLYSLTERLKLPEPTCVSGDKRRDLGHVLDFISQVQNLEIEGCKECVNNSNIIPNHLPFDLSPFKALRTLKIINCSNLRGKLRDLSSLRNTVTSLTVHESLDDLGSLLVGDLVHWSIADDLAYWPWWLQARLIDLSHNNINTIDPCIRLLKNVESIDLSHNAISSVENLESLPGLSEVNLSSNRIVHLDMLHTRLGNIKTLNLSGNAITSLQGLSRLYSLVHLDLAQNQVTHMRDLSHVASLPCLEFLILQGNPLTSSVDYRAHALVAFGSRAGEIILDGKAVSQKELDTVSVLQALQAAREGRLLRKSSLHESSRHKMDGSPVLYPGSEGLGASESEPNQFRQQVAALRRLGGSDWLRLLNNFQKEQDQQQKQDDVQECVPSGSFPEVDSGLGVTALCKTTVGCYFANRDIGGNVLLPEWIHGMNLGNSAFRNTVLKIVKSHDSVLGSVKKEMPIWSVWCLLLWNQLTGSRKFPACVVFYSEEIIFLSLDNLICSHAGHDKDVSTTLNPIPEPVLTVVLSIHPSNILSILLGPHECYVEIETKCTDIVQIILFFLSNTKELCGKLTSLYSLEAKRKFSQGELEEASRNALITHSSNVRLKSSAHIVQVMCCELVCKVKLEDHIKQREPRNVASFLIVTPELVVVLDESLVLPHTMSVLPLKVAVIFDVRSDVHSIQMKDSGISYHVCCCHESDKSHECKRLKEKCCLLHELYTCGFWLLVDFEGSTSLKVRFTSREARSRFLEAFLAARNQIN